jgi:halimadienyl-diphosphate synthase
MDLQETFREHLQAIGPGLEISRCAYSTAWVARLVELGEPIGELASNWLRAHQLADGSWGASEPLYFHDRLICTLAAATALARQERAEDRTRLERARLALKRFTRGLSADPAGETIGFEMIVPTLLGEAETLGLFQAGDNGFLARLASMRAAKLAALPGGAIDRSTTVAFSTEMVGHDGLHLLNFDRLQEANGSVAYSPSATAFFLRHVNRDPAALKFLHQVADNGAVPYVAPIDVFELAWTLWNLALTGHLDRETATLCEAHLDFLEANWTFGRGIASVAGFSNRDGDATSLTFDVLTRYGRSMEPAGVQYYEDTDRFHCYKLEANPSISTNVHALGALKTHGLHIGHPTVQKGLGFLKRSRIAGAYWIDKWHTSPYYPTCHAVIATAGYHDDLCRSAVGWILETQNADGSWGFYMPTAEETAYCLQALVIWRRNGGQVAPDILRRGAAWLASRVEPPYPSLWIGKGLYCPLLVVRSAILSALLLTESFE